MYKEFRIPMNIQKFAETPAGTAGENGGDGNGEGTGGGSASAGQIDYEKLASIVAGKQSATEESVLRGYFKQQGLTKEQADQAIATFKQQQAEKQPDIAGLQRQISDGNAALEAAKKAALQAQVESAATMAAVAIGLDAKTIPYVLKMADFSQAVGTDGKINSEELKNAVNKVLEDVPALKPQAQQQSGFRFGAPGAGTQPGGQDDQLAAIFGNKK